jgi:hypothetical protein
MKESVKQRKNRIPATAFKPGQSGNPKGRPKSGSTIADVLRDIGQQKKNGKTKLQIVLDKVMEMAMRGYMPAIEFIADRTEGKALERVLTRDADRDELIFE